MLKIYRVVLSVEDEHEVIRENTKGYFALLDEAKKHRNHHAEHWANEGGDSDDVWIDTIAVNTKGIE